MFRKFLNLFYQRKNEKPVLFVLPIISDFSYLFPHIWTEHNVHVVLRETLHKCFYCKMQTTKDFLASPENVTALQHFHFRVRPHLTLTLSLSLSLYIYIYIYIYWTYFSRRLFHLLWRSLPVECTWKCMQFETVSEPIFKVWQLAVHLVMWTIISTGCDVSCVSAKSCGKNSLSCVCLYHPKNSGPRYVIIFTHKLIFLPVLALKMTSTSI